MVGQLVPAPQPEYDYQLVPIGGSKEDIRLADQMVDGRLVRGVKIGEKWVGQTTMKLRTIEGHSNQLGWYIDELEQEIIFSYLSPDVIYRAEMVDRANPLFKLLGEWLTFNTDVAYAISRGGGELRVEDGTSIRERGSDLVRQYYAMYEGIAKVVVKSPLLVDNKADEGAGKMWVNRIPQPRLFQLWIFLTSELERIQDYFRLAAGALSGVDAVPGYQRGQPVACRTLARRGQMQGSTLPRLQLHSFYS